MPGALAVIPARMSATRLPGKPLLELGGRTVIEWVFRRTVDAGVFDEIVVATPDDEIADVARGFGARAELTMATHPTGTDRVAEVAGRLPGYDVIANVQGDQPFVTSAMLHALVSAFEGDDRPDMSTVACDLAPDGYADENTVKVLFDASRRALYFTRSPVPHGWTPTTPLPVLHHVGLYAFSQAFLRRFTSLDPTPLEQCERLEQLRALEHGFNIRVVPIAAAAPVEINTEADLARARTLLYQYE